MPIIGFSVLKDKLQDRSKAQTIRLPRKRPFKVGDKLYIYWKLRTKQCEKLGEGIIAKIEQKSYTQFTLEDAVKDGFNSIEELRDALLALHHEIDIRTKYDVITWRWF